LLPGFVEAQAGDGLWAGLGKADGAIPGDGQFQLPILFAPELHPQYVAWAQGVVVGDGNVCDGGEGCGAAGEEVVAEGFQAVVFEVLFLVLCPLIARYGINRLYHCYVLWALVLLAC